MNSANNQDFIGNVPTSLINLPVAYRRQSTASNTTLGNDTQGQGSTVNHNSLTVITNMMATYNEMIAENANTIKTNQEINHSNVDAMKEAIDALIQIVSHIDASLHNLEGTVATNIR
jgi:archaellum component FlaC|eukprot:g5488.t1 g5488   contig2:635047-635397(+)